jgi:HEAT repeat protein
MEGSSGARMIDLPTARAKLREGEEHVRVAALAELLRGEAPPAPIVAAVAECLNDASDHARALAVLVLERAGAAGISALAHALDDKQPISVRVLAAAALGRAGGNATPAIDPLCACLGSADGTLRWHAAFALGKIGAPAVPALRVVLRSADPEILRAAADALGWIGSGAHAALADLTALALSTALSVRLAIHLALVRITGDASVGLPMLLAALKEKDPAGRASALERIGQLRAMARESSPMLLPCLADRSGDVRAAAALALARIEATTPETIEALTPLLADSETDVRASAGIALASLGRAAVPALPALRVMRRATQPRLAAIARAAVQRISSQTESVK